MNALLKPIAMPLIRPSFRRWDLVREGKDGRERWIEANRDLLTQWHRQTGSYAEQDDAQAAFSVFADMQFESEHAQLESFKADREEEFDGASNGAIDWSRT